MSVGEKVVLGVLTSHRFGIPEEKLLEHPGVKMEDIEQACDKGLAWRMRNRETKKFVVYRKETNPNPLDRRIVEVWFSEKKKEQEDPAFSRTKVQEYLVANGMATAEEFQPIRLVRKKKQKGKNKKRKRKATVTNTHLLGDPNYAFLDKLVKSELPV